MGVFLFQAFNSVFGIIICSILKHVQTHCIRIKNVQIKNWNISGGNLPGLESCYCTGERELTPCTTPIYGLPKVK